MFVFSDYALSTESNQYSVTPGIDAGILEDAEKLRSKSRDTTQYVVVHFPEGDGGLYSPGTTLIHQVRLPRKFHSGKSKHQHGKTPNIPFSA